jgi:hypothetical protein
LESNYQLVNLLAPSTSSEQIEHKIYYNFIPNFHNIHLEELIIRENTESEATVLKPMVLMARKDQIDSSISAKHHAV